MMRTKDAEHHSPEAFIARWQGVSASELATSQSFIIDLCELLDVPRPHPTPEQDYMFERPVTFSYADGSTSAGRVDCYRRGHFIAESKKLKAAVDSERFSRTLREAHAQAQNYARALPADEGRPPFLLILDVGTVIEVYAEFSRSGATYTAFPDARSHRIALADLVKPEVRERLRLIWTDPDRLDPARISAQVTATVSAQLARLATSLEQAGHSSEQVAAYLTRCLFSMFAEDVELLPNGVFLGLLQAHRQAPATLQQTLRSLWTDMDRGGFCGALAQPVLKFNGKLFKGSDQDGYSLLLTSDQIELLIGAARANWREVEPAIFGTLLERALDPTERHALGAHYTPRAYVDRLVLPTVIEPLRAEWANAQAAALLLAHEAEACDSKKETAARLDAARAEVRRFHHRLCALRVLDPACGSGNFLYVTLEHLKRLEGEVFDLLDELGDSQAKLALEGETVTLQQLLGLELNPRAAALAELVLWIGYLQWQIRTFGHAGVAEPVVHNYGNIECRDAVLAWDDRVPALDEAGQPMLRWDGVTTKPHPATGEAVPDDSARVPLWRYPGARQADWPAADFIVGNPPFIGNKRMREALGDGYVEALRAAWPQVPDSADFVMFWWARAAALVSVGQVQRMGLITTNSLTMIFNRRIVQAALAGELVGAGAGHAGGLMLPDAQKSAAGMPRSDAVALSLAFAIPDHPWVDSTGGAAVRIAMTVLQPGAGDGCLQTVTAEAAGKDGEVNVMLAERHGVIHADLSIGANVAAAQKLRSNGGVSSMGMMRAGDGFIVQTEAEVSMLGLGTIPGLNERIRPFRNGKDLTDRPRGYWLIDLFGLTADEVRQQYPAVFQWVQERVKPERDVNRRDRLRNLWWIFGEPRQGLRAAFKGLPRYIATVETAKHRLFVLLDAAVLPDHKLVAVASDDALHLGVLSSAVHGLWALATGGRLGFGNDPVYSKSRCFDPFPFPSDDTGLTPELADRIRDLAEQIDAHRKRQQAAHADVTLTGLYNVLEKLRAGTALTAKDKTLHQHGLVGVLQSLHDELDAAVLAAYGWSDLRLPADSDRLLERLVALNARRAAEEANGRVRWLRPDFQTGATQAEPPEQSGIELPEPGPTPAKVARKSIKAKADRSGQASVKAQPWPGDLLAQVQAVADVLARAGGALDLDAIAAHFSARGRWRERLPSILDTLAALGRVHAQDGGLWVNVGGR